MLPNDLTAKTLTLKPGPRRSAVYFSGGSLRHLRLGYLLQRQFPDLLLGWFVVKPPRRSRREMLSLLQQKALGDVPPSRVWATVRKMGFAASFRRLRNAMASRLIQFEYPATEKSMFASEVARLSEKAQLHPQYIENTRGPELVEWLDQHEPYLLLTFGGPLIGTRLLKRVRGYAINQHAGFSPELKGSHTTEMALYHRRIDLVGSTVHLMDGFADSGDILRRSTATVHDGDNAAEAFLSVTALGNQLMLDVVSDLLDGDSLRVYPQPAGQGATVLNANLNYYRRRDIRKNAAAVIAEELREIRDF